jgi:ABC-type Na+ efflux pump permease subunit
VGFLWLTARRDLRRRATDPAALLLWVSIPILIGGLMTLAMGGRQGPRPQAHVLLVDEDETFLSRMLASGFGGQADTQIPVRVEPVSRSEGETRIAKGDGTALLIVPKGFAEALLEDRPTTLELITNPSQSLLPAFVEGFLDVLSEGTFYLQRLVGDPYRQAVGEHPPAASGRPDPAATAALVAQAEDLSRTLEATLFPPRIQLTTHLEKPKEEAPPQSFALLFLPGLVFMALLFIAQGMAEDLWVERESGTLRRVLVLPRRVSAFLAGKLMAGLVILGGTLLIALGLAASVYGIAWPAAALGFVFCLLCGLFFLLVLDLAYLFASSRRAASVLGSMLIFPLMMLGGAFFPFEAMPPWMVALGRLTPNGWALLQLKAILAGSASASTLLATSFALGLACLGLFWAAQRRLRGRFAIG